MLNKAIIMGRLTRDPEIRTTQSGTPVASFSLAVDRDMKDKTTGERATDFIDVVAWRSTADFVSRYFTKGSMAVVSGRIQVRDWTDTSGNKRRATEIVAESVYFAGAKREGQPATNGQATATTSTSRNNNIESEWAELDGDDGNLPF